jgi:capsule biosynthesis phosphatase
VESVPEKPIRLVVDVDGTLCETRPEESSYEDVRPREDVAETLRRYRRERGAYVVLHTSRQMRTYEGNVGLINVHTMPVLLDWLRRHRIPFDEVLPGKPWCGPGGLYIDDLAVRPAEFAGLRYQELLSLTGRGLPPSR